MPLFSIQCEPAFTRRAWTKSPRVLLQSDAPSELPLPPWVRAASDECAPQNLQTWRTGKVPDGFDGVLTWLSDEMPLSGSPAMLRRTFYIPGSRTFLPVHRPCLPEMPFLALEPRAQARNSRADRQNLAIRIASPAAVSPLALEAIRSNHESWAKLSAALLAELAVPGGGVEALLGLWQTRPPQPELYAALAVRNLFVALLRLGQVPAAEKLLAQAIASCPGYAELHYLAALWHLRENRPAQSLAAVEKARNGDRAWVGTGGENSYRADWLLGILARRAGNQRVAFDHLRRALCARPLFAPAVEEFTALRLPVRLVEQNQSDLCLAALEDPRLLAPIFDFFVRHRVFTAAAQLLQAAPLAEKDRGALEQRLREAQPPARTRQGNARTGAVVLGGPIFEHTSLARINREIALSLLDQSNPVSLESAALSELPPATFVEGDRLAPACDSSVRDIALTIRHQWPPDFRRPPEGQLAVILPWEYGAVPRAWVAEIERNVDELWVPSAFVRNVMRRSGISRTHIEVLPNGFDPVLFRPEGPASRPPGCRGCAFLFVGGAIRRKGLDLLLDAYEAAFDPGEDVTLVVYVSGANGSYRHNTLAARLKAFAEETRKPHLQILTDSLDDQMLAQLYRGCDALALPYRGEGFGMPLIEALACGTPVIATAAGPALEFCHPEYSYLVPASETLVPDEPPPLGPMSGDFTWFEPDFPALVQALRAVFENRADAAARGNAGARAMREGHTWKQVTAMYRRRIRKLLEAPNAPSACEQDQANAGLCR